MIISSDYHLQHEKVLTTPLSKNASAQLWKKVEAYNVVYGAEILNFWVAEQSQRYLSFNRFHRAFTPALTVSIDIPMIEVLQHESASVRGT